MLEAEHDADILSLTKKFPDVARTEPCRVSFFEDRYADVLRHLSDHSIVPLKIERLEPSLEDVFMEVAKQ